MSDVTQKPAPSAVEGLSYRELEEMHDFVHEIYPAEQAEQAEQAE